MKILILMRHAKSSWKDPDLPDHDRPLKNRGRKDAKKIGRKMLNHNLIPELILSSTAVRAKETVEAILEALEDDISVDYSESLYMAEPEDFLNILAVLPGDLEVVMLIGHNPGMEAFLQIINGNNETMPTASMVILKLKLDDWPDISFNTPGKLTGFWTPKSLE